ncbi:MULTISPECIES: DUF3306 domain-containing protein [unclassified Cobetia]|uniref:DUF3306 domain-containing protein n=1 Tax=unclassified Cobetia TaxID=2609414 RepID=UPI0020976EA5|nr:MULTISPECIES: DUF3306 domain-containing protein [unclassified Cobetia]MCO7233029.1 DUF3306 domain-containing protein [Cobetia sp. Dlab-2-AX]MCO7236303.1 DUF3306 domain-containing protein [Cobetia sp. Dlab-2-U]
MSQHDDNASPANEGLFSRWSRRKQGDTRREDQLAQPDSAVGTKDDTLPPSQAEVVSDHSADTSAARGSEHEAPSGDSSSRAEQASEQAAAENAQHASDADNAETPTIELPDPDTLTPDADISAFMQSGVDPALRQRALRRIFMGGEHSVRDGLDDYDQDFSKMRPLAEGVADTLRSWTRKVEEGLEKLDEARDTPQVDTVQETDDQIAEQAPDGGASVGETHATPREEIVESPDPQAIPAQDSPETAPESDDGRVARYKP